MEDTDIRPRSRISRAHKLAAVLLAIAVASAGWAWLMRHSRRFASTAVLAFDPALARQLDPGIRSAKHPAVAMADSLLKDETIASLTQQAHLAASTPTGRIGEFRSDLLLTQPSAVRLDVRFRAADASHSMAVASAVARALAAWKVPSEATTTPSTVLHSAAVSAPRVQHPARAAQRLSHASAAERAATQPVGATPEYGLSKALARLGANLSSAQEQLDRAASGESSSSGGGSSYSESRQLSLLRSEVRGAQSTLAGLRTRYKREAADASISAWLNEVQQALQSVVSAEPASRLSAARSDRWQISPERSGLSQAILIVKKETARIQQAEAAHAASNARAPAAQGSAATTDVNEPLLLSSDAHSAPSGVHDRSTLTTSPAGNAPQQTVRNPFSVVRLAGSAGPVPVWPAIVSGLLCGLLYLGVVALTGRRSESDDIYSEAGYASQHRITPSDPIAVGYSDSSLNQGLIPSGAHQQTPAECRTEDSPEAPVTDIDPVSIRLRKILAETSIGKSSRNS